ncbi:MAG: 4-alpha-glucanotransferase, partial [Paludibacteraceae bacterium]|nr:4-alpha-glucanotransferase [Paludibacteraceae bacterium]
MKINFNIQYHTTWGQRICIVGSIPALGKNSIAKSLVMNHMGNGKWEASIQIRTVEPFTYQYVIVDAQGNSISEWGENRVLAIPSSYKEANIQDTWRANGEDKTFYSSAFTESFCVRKKPKAFIPLTGTKTVRFGINVPRVDSELSVAIVGNHPSLGNWNGKNALILSDENYPQWTAEIDATTINKPLQYKYVLYNATKKTIVSWEKGENRWLETPSIAKNELTIKTDEVFQYDIPSFKAAGIALPIFSLRSSNSFGIGEFQDLKKLVDWSVQTGQKVIQTLPINDTTRSHSNADSYPYSSITVLALHPAYINIFGIGTLRSKKQMETFRALQQKLNMYKTVQYGKVVAAKWDYFRLIYKQEKTKTVNSTDYQAFFAENKQWLLPYAAFCYLRDKHNDANFRNWKNNAVFDWDRIDDFFKPEFAELDEVMVHVFLQYHAHKQLLEASNYAKSKGIVLKGDIPIGISPDSVEA